MTRRETFPAVTDFDREMADRGMVHFRGVLDAAHLATHIVAQAQRETETV